MKSLFDKVSADCSRLTTKTYSTSFSLGILFLQKHLRPHIYAIYGLVRFADEIVDSFHGYDKAELLSSFREETAKGIREGISLNPVINAFQSTFHHYQIEEKLVDAFFDSMEMDLVREKYDRRGYEQYIYGSAEVVGLMCLHVFSEGDSSTFEKLKPYAMRLGAAFQKINFLRDLKDDNLALGRTYFPNIDLSRFSSEEKKKIEKEIEVDLAVALMGIERLPGGSRNGVYLAYYYYSVLFRKIKRLPASKLMDSRIRIPNAHKLYLMFKSTVRYQLRIL